MSEPENNSKINYALYSPLFQERGFQVFQIEKEKVSPEIAAFFDKYNQLAIINKATENKIDIKKYDGTGFSRERITRTLYSNLGAASRHARLLIEQEYRDHIFTDSKFKEFLEKNEHEEVKAILANKLKKDAYRNTIKAVENHFDEKNRPAVVEMLKQNEEKIEQRAAFWRKASHINLLQKLASGEFDWDRPLLSTEELDIETVKNLFDINWSDKKLHKLWKDASDQMAQRFFEYETALHQKIAEESARHAEAVARESARIAEQVAAQKALEAARHTEQVERDRAERAEQARAAHEAFMAKPQPYVLNEAAEHDARIVQDYAGSSANNAKNAALLVKILEESRTQLDIRGNNIKELGDLLFSAKNIVAAARAVDAGNPFADKAAGNGRHENIKLLRKLRAISSDVDRAVGALLDSKDGIILLASLVCEAASCKRYAAFVCDHEAEIKKREAEVHTQREKLKDFSDADLAQMLDQSEVQMLQAARTNLARELENMRTTHDAFAAEVRQTFQGLSRKRIAHADIPLQKTPAEQALVSDKQWLEAMGNDFHAAPSPEGEKHLLIVSNDFPDMFFDIKKNAGKTALDTKLTSMRAEVAIHRTNIDTLRTLGEECGFVIHASPDGLSLLHREYGIDIPLKGTESQQAQALENAKERFEEKYFEQESLIAVATQAGIRLPEALTARKYFDSAAFSSLRDSYERAAAAKTLPAAIQPSVKEDVVKGVSWRPRKGEVFIIFDATTLISLAAKRPGSEKTWLDLIRYTSQLQNVRVIIPSAIADWELRGKIPKENAKINERRANDFQIVDEMFHAENSNLGRQTRELDKLLDSASRLHMDAKGHLSFARGQDTNIIIVENEGDRELFKKIREIVNQSPHYPARIKRFEQDIRGHHEGDKSITRLVGALPPDTQAVIVSDDMAYLRGREPWNKAPKMSGSGMPVAHAGTQAYIDAECRAREPWLRQFLEAEKALTSSSVTEAIRDYFTEDYRHHISGYNRKAAAAENSGVPMDIYEVIRTGHEQSLQKTHAHEGLKKPINPDEISRGGNSVGGRIAG